MKAEPTSETGIEVKTVESYNVMIESFKELMLFTRSKKSYWDHGNLQCKQKYLT